MNVRPVLSEAPRFQIMHDDPANTTALRRIKHVEARELPPGTPEVIGEPTPRPAPLNGPAVTRAAHDPEAPVIDPTRYGRRHRRPSHVRQYRVAQVAIAASVLATAAALACLLLGDRSLARVAAGGAFFLAACAVLLSWRTRLSARVSGYAVSAAVLASLASLATLALPAHLIEDPDGPDQGRVERVTPRDVVPK